MAAGTWMKQLRSLVHMESLTNSLHRHMPTRHTSHKVETNRWFEDALSKKRLSGPFQPSRRDLLEARELFVHLLARNAIEPDWQKFFTIYPWVFSEALPYRLQPADIVPLGRRGRTEPDLAFFPDPPREPFVYGTIEIKNPGTPLFTVTRKTVIVPTTDVSTGLQQGQIHSHELDQALRARGSLLALSINR